ncbi:hypothetical protein EDD29_9046 [Actinocorallia herbida]|uniref:Uncharacterized protein n=1 Tax=Actinocorallia herbida TaxID=58109 RepID=A0A3N1DCQ4_9ACTN|nr:hypothetical protein EDD29_9046 [Actinocorallia herbida]
MSDETTPATTPDPGAAAPTPRRLAGKTRKRKSVPPILPGVEEAEDTVRDGVGETA